MEMLQQRPGAFRGGRAYVGPLPFQGVSRCPSGRWPLLLGTGGLMYEATRPHEGAGVGLG